MKIAVRRMAVQSTAVRRLRRDVLWHQFPKVTDHTAGTTQSEEKKKIMGSRRSSEMKGMIDL
jgi:hypothetical protein